MRKLGADEAPALGDLGFECGDSAFSVGISEVTGGGDALAPSHVFIVGQAGEVFEAWAVARRQPLSKYDEYRRRGRVEIYRPDAPRAAKATAYGFILGRYEGAPYGVPQIAGHFLVEMARKAKIEIANPAQGGVVCHEVGIRYLQRLNFHAHMLGVPTDCEWADALDPEQENPYRLRERCAGRAIA